MNAKKVLLSGIQPSGRLHIGNYFGAMKQFVDMQDDYDTRIAIVNYHSLTTVQDAKRLSDDTLSAAIDHMAIGLDPKEMTLFIQSDVPEVTELAWILGTLVNVPYLSRAHAYKDKTSQGIEASVGLFTYPVLMAADILLADADVVPVGADQKQHVEMARDIAQKFNQTYGETFKIPDVLIREDVATVPGTDGQKMSKSYGNTIPLFATQEEIAKAVMSIVTDSSGGVPQNVYAIHKLFKSESELEKLYAKNEGSYKALKEALIYDIDAFVAPFREKRAELAANPDAVRSILAEGGERMRGYAKAKMKDIRKKTGLSAS